MSDSEWLKKYYQERDERAAGLPKRGEMLGAKLKELGVIAVNAEYSGSGDSGQIDGVNFIPETLKVPPEIATEVEQLFYDVLEVRYAGWENNDGGCGTFAWNLEKDPKKGFNHEHITYYTESESTQHTGFAKK